MSKCEIKFINPVTTENYENATKSTYVPNSGSAKEGALLSTPEGTDFADKFFELNGEALKEATLKLNQRSFGFSDKDIAGIRQHDKKETTPHQTGKPEGE